MKESLSVRLRRLAAEAFKFLTVGGLGYIVDVGLSNVLAYGLGSIPALLEGSPIKAKIISTIISMVVVSGWATGCGPTVIGPPTRTCEACCCSSP